MIDDGRNGRLLSRACSSTIVIVSDDEWIGADLQLRIQPENEASLGRGHHVRGGEAANSGRVEAIWDGANEVIDGGWDVMLFEDAKVLVWVSCCKMRGCRIP